MPRRKRSSPGTEPDTKAKRPRQQTTTQTSRKHHHHHHHHHHSSRSVEAESTAAAAAVVAAFSSKRCTVWFHEYCGVEQDMIEPEGMEKFCEDIGVEPENIVMLSLAWKLGAQQMGFFSLAEWLRGMTDLQCDSISKLQHKLDYLRSILNEPVTFKSIYRYAFDFAREKGQRSMEMGTAKIMLALLLGKRWPLFSSFHQFLEQSKYKVINKDQWCNVLEFSRLIKADLSNYDEDGAWPVMLDEFVEWYREQNPNLASARASSSSSTSMC